MNIEVRYLSKSGNTKKVADAIASELGVLAQPITREVSKNTDILFIGGALYWAGIDSDLKKFIMNLDSTVKKVAVFSTASIAKSAYPEMKKLLEARGIKVSSDEFHCRGEFMKLHKNRPNQEDLILAKKFARDIVK